MIWIISAFLLLIIIFDSSAMEFLPPRLELTGRVATEAKKLQLEHDLEYFKAKDDYDLIYEFIASYGVNKRLGFILSVPFFIKRKVDGKVSKGLSDILIGPEYTIYGDRGKNLGLVMGALVLPTGKRDKVPAIGSGSLGVFLKFDGVHTSERWFAQVNWGGTLRVKRKSGTKFGNNYFFELACGRRFKFKPDSPSTFFAILEMDGFYAEEDRIRGILNRNSGGSTIFLGPLFSWARKNLLVQALVQPAIGNHLFGRQKKFDLHASLSVQITM
jgi:hypothetical protein